MIEHKFEIFKNSGANPIEGIVHDEEEQNISEKILSSNSWIEKQKLFSENISEITKNWKNYK